MKKVFKYFVLFTFISMLFPMTYKAESINSECYFDGSITPKHKFMPGDKMSLDDFNIDGKLMVGNETYGLESFDSYIMGEECDNAITEDKNVSIDFVFVSQNRDFNCRVPVTITYAPFNPKITSQLDGKTFTIDKVHWKSEDGFDTISYLDEIDKRVLNTQGKEIDGALNLSGKANVPSLGYNTVTYRFKPFDERYSVLYGEFTVIYKRAPYMVVQKDFINIHLPESRYKVYLNGKLQKDHFISKLKSNTKYKIVVKQKNTPVGKNVTVWTGTIKTKK